MDPKNGPTLAALAASHHFISPFAGTPTVSYVQFDQASAALQFIRDKADDIEIAAIPRDQRIEVPSADRRTTQTIETGLVLQFIDGGYQLLSPVMADAIIHDGILGRMRIPLGFFEGQDDGYDDFSF